MKIIGILAAYNLQDSIGAVVKETSKYVDEVIVVSDASSDKTNEMALPSERESIFPREWRAILSF